MLEETSVEFNKELKFYSYKENIDTNGFRLIDCINNNELNINDNSKITVTLNVTVDGNTKDVICVFDCDMVSSFERSTIM